MKNLLLRYVLMLLLIPVLCPLTAQSVVKVNPFGLLFGTLNASYEKFVQEDRSFTLRANYYDHNVLGVKFSGFGIGGGYRFYLTENTRPKGLYAGPVANIGRIDPQDETIGNYTLITLGGILGYQLTIGQHFTLEAHLGPAFGIISGRTLNDNVPLFGSGVIPIISLFTLGYSFD